MAPGERPGGHPVAVVEDPRGTRHLSVLLVGPGYPPRPGGVERVMQHQAEGLARRGVHVEVVVHGDGPRSGERTSLVHGVRVHRFPSWTPSRRFPVAPGLVAFLAASGDRFDIVHGHSFHALPGVVAAWTPHARYVCTPHFHGTGHTPLARFAHRFFQPLARRAVQRARRVICVSDVEARLVASTFGVDRRAIAVLPNGVDVDAFTQAAPFPVDRPVVLVVGRLEPYKRVDAVLQAVAVGALDVEVRIVGDGSDRPRLQELACRLRIDHRTVFCGSVGDQELQRWLRTAAAVVSLSEHEAFGLVLLEAVAAGARVVASDIPAHREVVDRYGVPARLVTVGASPDVVADALRRSVTEAPATGVPMCLPSWEQQVEGHLAVYRSIVPAGSDRRGGVR